MINDRHAEGFCFGLQVAPDAAHAEDAEDLALRVVAERLWRGAAPCVLPERLDAWVVVAEGAEDQEHGCVGGCVVDGVGDVGDVDAVGGAGGDVDLVVAGAWGEVMLGW